MDLHWQCEEIKIRRKTNWDVENSLEFICKMS
uniref:Uncharacterized protein n=1 Tax=Rhizophora mucronata TaxID=61149 RepID=A0A2P2MGF8_RHIMU